MTHPTTEQIAARGKPIIPFPGQSFANKREWIARAKYVLTAHPEYHNTEHDGPSKGWRGNHFTALCYDQKGRRVRRGGDFQSAEDDDAFPVWWVWPDQIAALLREYAGMGQLPSGLAQDGITDWPPTKKAIWGVVVGEALNDGHYINSYDLTEKLHASVIAALEPAPGYLAGWNDAREAAAKVADDIDTDSTCMSCTDTVKITAAIRALTPPERPSHD